MPEHRHSLTAADWDARYAHGPHWSGRVNAALAAVVKTMPAGRALDLGAGEGGDSVWLAEAGWHVVAAEWSPTALERARVAARERGVEDRIHFLCTDLTVEIPSGEFDLVCASFFMWGDDAARNQVLRRCSDRVSPGGILVVIDHGCVPPGSGHPPQEFATPEQTYEALDLGAGWQAEQLLRTTRMVVVEDGDEAPLIDHVVVARRLS